MENFYSLLCKRGKTACTLTSGFLCYAQVTQVNSSQAVALHVKIPSVNGGIVGSGQPQVTCGQYENTRV